ncbi:hypothetical protein JTB14_033487 [Gonioctena quinquepunctata]|nr:hypothetical protein JTB14_033487 [Gonioctena quinquepunctata]
MVMGPRDEARLSESYEEVSTSDDYVDSDSEKSETFEDVDGKFSPSNSPENSSSEDETIENGTIKNAVFFITANAVIVT